MHVWRSYCIWSYFYIIYPMSASQDEEPDSNNSSTAQERYLDSSKSFAEPEAAPLLAGSSSEFQRTRRHTNDSLRSAFRLQPEEVCDSPRDCSCISAGFMSSTANFDLKEYLGLWNSWNPLNSNHPAVLNSYWFRDFHSSKREFEKETESIIHRTNHFSSTL